MSIDTIVSKSVDDLFGIAIPEHLRESAVFPTRANLCATAEKFVPGKKGGYIFRKSLVKVMQQWVSANNGRANILFTGDTGTGKTSLIEQVASRLGWPVFRQGCHVAMEFQELVGRQALVDGSTKWVDGPMVMAMRHGGILLLDEINMIPPGTAGALNTALDTALAGNQSKEGLIGAIEDFKLGINQSGGFSVAETGEMVRVHPCFRIAATGNALDGAGKSNYRGVQTPNIALMDRFTIGAKIDYMTIAEEVQLFNAVYPIVSNKIVQSLCEVAKGTRDSYAAGTGGCLISTRVLDAIFAQLASSSTDDEAVQLKFIGEALQMSLLYRINEADAGAIMTATESLVRQNFGNTLPKDWKLK